MPSSPRKVTWHFETNWTLPFLRQISPVITSDLLHDVESVLQRDLLVRKTRPPNIRSAELKYKLSDLEAALNKPPTTIRFNGYLQMELIILLTVIICFVGFKRLGIQLTDNWVGALPIANGAYRTRNISM